MTTLKAVQLIILGLNKVYGLKLMLVIIEYDVAINRKVVIEGEELSLIWRLSATYLQYSPSCRHLLAIQ